MFNVSDVVLDTFPFGGGVTSLQTLAMGAPLVTLLPLLALASSSSSRAANHTLRMRLPMAPTVLTTPPTPGALCMCPAPPRSLTVSL